MQRFLHTMKKYLIIVAVLVISIFLAGYSVAAVIFPGDDKTAGHTTGTETAGEGSENPREKTPGESPANGDEPEEPKFEDREFNEKAQRISQLVLPSIVYGTMTGDDGDFRQGEQVEIIRDRGNGRSYYVSAGGRKGWISGDNVSIPEDFPTVEKRMEKEDMEFFVNHIKGFVSQTNYFIWVDLSRQLVNVFEGQKGNWQLMRTFLCATGINRTPTIRGTFMVDGRGPDFVMDGEGAKNWVRFCGSYLFHSVTVDPDDYDNIIDATLGKRASHGCVRMSLEDSKWVYDHIPDGTTVWVN